MKIFQLQIIIAKKQLENVECFDYLSSMITNAARGTRKIKSRSAMTKAAFNTKKTLQQQIEVKFKEKN